MTLPTYEVVAPVLRVFGHWLVTTTKDQAAFWPLLQITQYKNFKNLRLAGLQSTLLFSSFPTNEVCSTSIHRILHYSASATLEMYIIQNYEYSSLEDPAEYIKLLKLRSSATDRTDDLRGELITCRCKEAPCYQPVSHTWGQ